jgi:type I restriction enzyme, R subunit
VRDEVAFMQPVKALLTKRELRQHKRTQADRDQAMRQIINQAVVSDSVVDIFDAVELLERLLEGEIKARFATYVVQQRRFSDMLASNPSAVRELSDETLRKIAHELTDNLRRNLGVDWSQRDSVRATLRLMVKRILRKYRYPPDQASEATELVLQQAETLGEAG